MEELYLRLPKNRIQQALAESRQFSRSDERAAMRKVSSDTENWQEFAERGLADPSTCDQMMRTLSSLTESYVRTATPIARSAFEEARRAAERSDAKRLFREIEKISRAVESQSLQSSDDWVGLIWLRTSSSKTRDRIAHLAKWTNGLSADALPVQPAPEPPLQPVSSLTRVDPVPTSSPTMPPEDSATMAVEDNRSNHREGPEGAGLPNTSSTELIRYLEAITSPPKKPTWGLENSVWRVEG